MVMAFAWLSGFPGTGFPTVQYSLGTKTPLSGGYLALHHFFGFHFFPKFNTLGKKYVSIDPCNHNHLDHHHLSFFLLFFFLVNFFYIFAIVRLYLFIYIYIYREREREINGGT